MLSLKGFFRISAKPNKIFKSLEKGRFRKRTFEIDDLTCNLPALPTIYSHNNTARPSCTEPTICYFESIVERLRLSVKGPVGRKEKTSLLLFPAFSRLIINSRLEARTARKE
jgi:hypothetical protein